MISAIQGWTSSQKHVVAASFLAWTLDAMDFFLLTFVFNDIARDFATSRTKVTIAVMLTLACRPVGAFIFGRLADHFGRRPILILNIAIYSLFSFSTAFTHELTTFLIVRALFGIGMGGIWGVGSSLSMETIKPESRGFVSGVLQSGYSFGYLLAAVIFAIFYIHVGWRGMFMVGIIPSLLLIPYVWAKVPESPIFARAAAPHRSTAAVLRQHWKLALYATVTMMFFNFFSHGTQDFYPNFLQSKHMSPTVTGSIAVIYNIGAVIGCLIFASFSQHFGRRRTMITAALLSISSIWLWAFSPTIPMLVLGAFFMNLFVQGCWSVIPAHLNELSPQGARATFPGTVYQLGNLLASGNLTIQALVADSYGYGVALGSVAFFAALAIIAMLAFGPEAHNAEMRGTT
jgi:SHS family lactate transporter-like MFS transporter